MSAPGPLAQTILQNVIVRQENTDPAANNPGGITHNKVLVRYPTPEAGQTAALQLVQTRIDQGLTLEQLTALWVCGDKNARACPALGDPLVYAQHAAQWTGLPLDVPLSQLDSQGGGGAHYTAPDATAGAGEGDTPVAYTDASTGAGGVGTGMALGLGALLLLWAFGD